MMMKINYLTLTTKKNELYLPTPCNINLWWNYGSMLGICLIIQFLTGVFLSFHYTPHIDLAFPSIIHMNYDVNYGWILHFIHANGASMFFICIYCHIGRSIYYKSYKLYKTWTSGVMNFLIIMATAFLGYVLPWGQMSFWGATVITNLFSTVPVIGNLLVSWLWGGFAINNATLNRFYSFHFMMPFILIAFILIHLIFLHETGSSNPLGLNSNLNKIPFHKYFTIKDFITINLMLMFLMVIIFQYPLMFNDPENFIPANPLVTPEHIQPEWYFLFAYAILRSIPNKLGGVIALLFSILILLILPLFNKNLMIQSNKFNLINKMAFWAFISNFFFLTWIGMMPVEEPLIVSGQMSTIIYFMFFIFHSPIKNIEFKLMS